MVHDKKRITGNPNKKPPTTEQKKQRLTKRQKEWDWDYSIHDCFNHFIVAQLEKGNRKETINFYKRFYSKFEQFIAEAFDGNTPRNLPIELLVESITIPVFREYLGKTGNIQTVNSYLRGYRAFGNWCENEGYIDGFKCPIKEEEPPVKEVYTDKELERLLKKPDITSFSEFRMFCIIELILNTGARCNTILNIRINDLEVENGYINFNTTKAHKIARLGVDKKTCRDLSEWLRYWRLERGAEANDFLFCNEYGEQLARSSLSKAMRIYCEKRGVEKTSLHLLRHTFAKMWITSGGDIISLAKVLTHSELEMVKRYANLYGGDIKKEQAEHSAMAQLKTKSGKTLKNQKKKITDED